MSNEPSKPEKKKRKYAKPSLKTESLTAIAALCNGTNSGGRKAATPACNATKLKS